MKLDQSLSYTLQQIRAGQHIAQYLARTERARAETGSVPSSTNPTLPGNNPSVSNPGNSTSNGIDKNSGTANKAASRLDFTQMNRSQLNDWLSKAKAAGKISSEQETAFKVLTYSAKTGSSASSEVADDEQVNFTEKAKQALQSAAKRRDRSAITFWANTLAVMKNFQGEKLTTTSTEA